MALAIFATLPVPRARAVPAAQDTAQPPAPDDPVPVEAVMPYAAIARHDQLGVIATSHGGYDGSSGAPVLAGSIEATVYDRIAIHTTVASDAASPQTHAAGGVTVDVLRQATSGVDLAVGEDYDSRGWNQVPAFVSRIAVARTVGDNLVVARAAFGLGTEQGERFGEVEVGGVRRLGDHLRVGFDAHGAIDLERDDQEPEAEPDWGVQAGAVASYALGRVSLSAFTGGSSWKLRLVDRVYTGVIGSLGVGVAF